MRDFSAWIDALTIYLVLFSGWRVKSSCVTVLRLLLKSEDAVDRLFE